MIVKEFGSDFHFCNDGDLLLKPSEISDFQSSKFSYFISGRAALYWIVAQGINQHGWEIVYFPSYYCHEVVEAIAELPIKVAYFSYHPFHSDASSITVDDRKGVVYLDVLFFGEKRAPLGPFEHAMVIDDVTHNLATYTESTADYCFGSIRKELPVPVGGFCFSPNNYNLPKKEIRPRDVEVCNLKLEAMRLKMEYLKGNGNSKSEYRQLFSMGEKLLGHHEIRGGLPKNAEDLFFGLNSRLLKEMKRNNLKRLIGMLASVPSLKECISIKSENALGMVLYFDSSDTRDRLMDFLIKRNIYPAVLWPSQRDKDSKKAEDRMLFIHADYRYGSKDIMYIGNTIRSYFNA